MTLLHIRGSGGSGKSYIARRIIDARALQPVYEGINRKRPIAYTDRRRTLAVLGPYTATCGGLDGVGSIAEQIDLVSSFSKYKIVVFEGLLSGKSIGTFGEAMRAYGDRYVSAFLDTPLHVCIERVGQRRSAAGNTKPLSTHNLENDYRALTSARRRAEEQGFVVIDVPYRSAYTYISRRFIVCK